MTYDSNSNKHKNKLCGHWGNTRKGMKYPKNRKSRPYPSQETRDKMSAANMGRVFSEETKHNIAVSAAKRAQRDSLLHNRKPTNLEYALQMLLEDVGFDFEAQVRFGRYIVDAYVASRNLVFEADGQFWYWHKDKKREAKRDEYLRSSGIDAVIHLTDEDLDPWTV